MTMATKKQTTRTVSDSLRMFIERDERTQYALAIATGVNRGVLSRFMRGQRDIGMATVDRLARAMDLRLVKGE